MNLLIFDMDGVLLKPLGYHRALKETVRLAGIAVGYGEVLLTDAQITHFEALGISSEWHSSALCQAVMKLQQQKSSIRNQEPIQPVTLKLDILFEAIAAQPMEDPALNRGLAAIEYLAAINDLPAFQAMELVENSESFLHSPTIKWFQEFILGSDAFSDIYQKKAQFQTESYLMLYDEKLISTYRAEHVMKWATQIDCGAAIMTNRPSRGLPGIQGAPDADMGASMARFENIPLIGYGEVEWMAKHASCDIAELSKPGSAHALAAILTASGWPIKQSLVYASHSIDLQARDRLDHLQDSKFTVFEDTPAGLVAVQKAGDMLNQTGLNVKIQKIGITEDPKKQAALSAQGAEVFPDINAALDSLDDLGLLPSN